MDPDLELLEAWRRGDERAAGILFDRHYHSIRGLIATKIPEPEIDDLVQRVFVGLLEGRERFRGDATFKTYAMKIARNTVADFYRKRRKVDSLDILEISASDHGVGPSTWLDDQKLHRLLLEALRSIPLDDQIILELHFWEKMSGPELAQVFEIGEPAIRSRIRRAKERLRARVEAIAVDQHELEDTLTDLDAWALKLREALAPHFRQRLPR